MNITKIKSLKAVCALLLIFAITVKAGTSIKINGEPAEKKKTINRSFTVNSSEKLKIENSFGTVKVLNGNSGTIQVDIEITTKSDDDAEAQKMIDEIKIKEDRSGGTISFITSIGDKKGGSKTHSKSNTKREFSINYTVTMPVENPLDVENSFGKLITADRTGETTLASKFGELNAGKIAKNGGITAEFGKAGIASVNGGKITIKFCGDVKIDNLGGDVKLVTEYSDAAITLGSGLTGLNLVNSFSGTRLNLPAGLPVSLTASCNFGDCINKTSFPLKQVTDEDNRYSMEKNYEGNSGDGSVKIKIKTNFGSVRIMNPGDKDDPKDKKKKKQEGDEV